MSNKIFKNKRIVGIYPLNQAITGGHIPPGPLTGPKGIQASMEYWDGDSFANLTDPKIKCYWNHDRSLQLGSIGRGSLRLWLTNDALNFELIQEVGNEIAEFVFAKRMVEEEFVGLSPGYRTEASGKKPVDGAHHVRAHLGEFSLTPRPTHKGSRAWVESDMDKKALAKHMNTIRREIDAARKTYIARQEHEIEAAWEYLNEQKKLKAGLKNTPTEGWSREQIDEFKRNHARFKASEARGYEHATVR